MSATKAQTLLKAAAAGAVDTIRACLAEGVPVDCTDKQGYTPLMRAAEAGHVDALWPLFESGANAYAEAADHFTPLLLATRNVEVLRVFVTANADLDRGNKNGVTPLMLAAQEGHRACVELLVEAGVDLNKQDRHGRTARERARAHQAIVDFLSARMGGVAKAAPAKSGKQGSNKPKPLGPQLARAARRGEVEAIAELLAQGAPLEFVNRDGHTPLMVAAEAGQLDAVRALLAAGATLEPRISNSGVDALYFACAHGHIEIVQALLAHGALVNPPPREDGLNYTPLMGAALSGRLELVQLLVEAGADVHAVNDSGETAIKWAREQKHKAIVSYLKELMGSAPPPAPAVPATPAEPADPGRPMQVLRALVENFPIAATEPAFQSLLDLLNGLTRRKFLPSPRRPGIYVCLLNQRSLKHLAGPFQLPAPTFRAADFEEDLQRVQALVARLQDEVRRAGYLLMADTNSGFAEGIKLWLYPTSEKYGVLAACGTNGNNYGLSTRAVIGWLQELEAQQPFDLTSCGHDHVAGHFTGPVQQPLRLMRRMIEFCPDLEGDESVKEMARGLEDSRDFFFWWD